MIEELVNVIDSCYGRAIKPGATVLVLQFNNYINQLAKVKESNGGKHAQDWHSIRLSWLAVMGKLQDEGLIFARLYMIIK